MDNRKRLTGSSSSGSSVYWSFPFLRQPARVLIIEALPPWWSSTCSVLCDALDNFLSLASSLDGPCRIPLLSVYAISRQQECLLPFVQVRGSLARLRSCVGNLRSISQEGCTSGPARVGEMLLQAVIDSLQQFQQFMRHTSTGSQASNNTTVEVTVVTSQPGRDIVRHLESGLKGADLLSLKRLLVVQIFIEGDSGQDTPSPEALHAENEDSVMLGTEVDLHQVDNSVFAVETMLKVWLQEQGGDKEHLHLFLPSPQKNPNPVCIKCDMQERLISPVLIPQTPNLGVRTESIRDFVPFTKGSANQSQEPQTLKAIKVLRAEGLCESVLYGLPLLVHPTICWQLDWEEMETNHNLFHALCHTLRSRDLFLLLQLEPTQSSSVGGPGVHSYYVLQPSPSLSFLLKPVVSRELFLPCSLPVPPEEPSTAATQIIQDCVSQLDEEYVLNPLTLSTNLYQHLRSRGLLSQTKYPYRLQAPSQRYHSQPPYGSKTTVSRTTWQQQNQGLKLGTNSKVRATVAPMPPSSSRSSSGPPPAKASRPVLTFSRSSSGSCRRPDPCVREKGDDDEYTVTP